MAKTRQKHEGLTPVQFEAQIGRGQIEPLYLFVGPEQLLRREAIAVLTETIDESFRTFNVDTFSAADEEIETIFDVARQLPMMAARRLVVVERADAIKEGAQERLEAYLKAPCPEATVVFAADSLDMRKKSATALSKGCTVVSFAELSDADATKWAEGRLRARDCRIDRNALGALVDLAGHDLTRLSLEVDKLATHAGRGTVSLSAVEALVARSREGDIWELTDAVSARDRKRALRVLTRQLDAGAEPLALLGMLASTYRKMLLAKELMARHAPAAEVQSAAKLPPWKMGEFNGHVRRMRLEEITHGLRRMAQVDLAIKSSIGTPRLQIEVLVCELTGA